MIRSRSLALSAALRYISAPNLFCQDDKGQGMRAARFNIGQIVRHRIYAFRGVVYDVDPVFSNSEEWWESIPEDIRPSKDQPFYHLLAENDQGPYMAYVSEQNLLEDETGDPIDHPDVEDYFQAMDDEGYIPYDRYTN